MRDSAREPIGVILAGGRGRRIGGAKALIELGGRPLISYPLAALRASLADVAIVAKADSELPELQGVPVWTEPPQPRHPLTGILYALECAAGRPVLVCAADLPLVTPALAGRIAATDANGAPAVIPSCAGVLQPLLALYLPAAGRLLADAAHAPDLPLRELVAAIGPHVLEVPDSDAFFNVNSREDLARATELLSRRAGPTSRR